MHPLMRDLPEKYLGERVYLRPMKKGDGEAFLNVLTENSDHLKAVVDEVKTITTVEASELRNRRLYADWVARRRFVFGIFNISNDDLIGEIWIEPIDWKIPVMEIGYFIVKNCEGKGYVSESVKVALIFLFEYLEVEKAEIHTDITNNRSFKVAENLGFIKEATLRRRGKNRDGTFVDRLHYGLLKEEYQEAKETLLVLKPEH